MVQTWTGASGAPNTLSSNLRSDLLQSAAEEEAEPEAEEETEGALVSCPFIQWPHFPSPPPPPPRFESWSSFPSGPSFKGESASKGLKLPDLEMNNSGGGAWCLRLRRSKVDIGDGLLAGLLDLDLDGESPRTTSSFSAEKKPCFLSIITKLS